MAIVFITHPKSKLPQYFGEHALLSLKSLAGVSEVRLNTSDHELSTHELINEAQGCDALIAYRQTPAPESLFDGLPDLVAFLRCAVDIRTVDVNAASKNGILVTQASPGYAASVSEWILAAMVDLARGISDYAKQYHEGKLPLPHMGKELRGSTLGVIGYGEIGQYVTELALAFGMRVLVNTLQPISDRERLTAVSFNQLLTDSDFVVCLAPANEKTNNLMNSDAFNNMRPGSFFINASRGELVDDTALMHSLNSGRLAGCALDVGRSPDQMPSLELAMHPRVLAAPHIGGLTPPAIEHQAKETVAQLKELLELRLPRGVVNPLQAHRLIRWGHNNQ